jgi:SAM-dependent methyltransferase
VYGESDSALAKIPDERFDCIIATDLIHRFPAPEKLLASFSKLLTPGGTVVASVPNLMQVGVWWRRIKRDHWFINLNGFEQAGIHRTSRLKVRRWFDAAGLTVLKVAPMIPDRARTLDRITGKICSDLLAQEFIFIAENR